MTEETRVLIADGMAENGLDILRSQSEFKIDLHKAITSSDLLRVIPDYQVLVVRSATQVTSEVIAMAKSLKLIVRAGAGIDNINVAKASEKKIAVMNTASANSLAAAEHTLALLFALWRNIPQANQSLKEGRWDREKYKGQEISGKTLGILGLGNIGSIVAKKARALDMKVLGYDPVAPHIEGIERAGSMEAVLQHCDVLSLHLPKSKSGRYLIGPLEFQQMRKGSSLIQCARGGLVDEEALLAALESGHLAGAALDVFEEEPPVGIRSLLNHPRVVATPHLGASTLEAQERVASTAAEQILGFFKKNEKKGIINLDSLSA